MGEAREVARGSVDYPARLMALERPPDRLFLEGPWHESGPRVAIVGSRSATEDGLDFTLELAGQLAHRGIAVISGLARGIDAAAHDGALRANGLTGAVLGTPLDHVYPRDHHDLQAACASSLGLLTEHPSGAPVKPGNFASRNRLVAALADAVILVQGGARSGALLTVAAARRLGRPIGAVPWDPRDEMAEAPLGLIRAAEATLIRDADDVAAMLGLEPLPGFAGSGDPANAPAMPNLSERESRLYQALRHRADTLESAADRAGLTIAEASAALVNLEVLGWAAREPGGRARRRRRTARRESVAG